LYVKNRNRFLGFILIFIAGSVFTNGDALIGKSLSIKNKAFDSVMQAVFDKRLSEYRQAYKSKVDNSMADAGVSYFDLGDDEILLKSLIDQYAHIQAQAFVIAGLKELAKIRSLQQLDFPESLEKDLEKIDRDDPFYVQRPVYGEQLKEVVQKVYSIIESKKPYQSFRLVRWLLPAGIVGTGLAAFFAKKWWWDGLKKPPMLNKGSSSTPEDNEDNSANDVESGHKGNEDGGVFVESKGGLGVLPAKHKVSIIGNPGRVLSAGQTSFPPITISQKNSEDVVKDLLNCQEFTDPYNKLAQLIDAIKKSGTNSNVVDNNGSNAFHFYACCVINARDVVNKGDEDSIRFLHYFCDLVGLGVYYDAKNNEGVTPLALLVNRYGEGGVVKDGVIKWLVIHKGADIGKLNETTKQKLNNILQKILSKDKEQGLIKMLFGDINDMILEVIKFFNERNLLIGKNNSEETLQRSLFPVGNLIQAIFIRGDVTALKALLGNKKVKNFLKRDAYRIFMGSETIPKENLKRLELALSSLMALGQNCRMRSDIYEENVKSLESFIKNAENVLEVYRAANFDLYKDEDDIIDSEDDEDNSGKEDGGTGLMMGGLSSEKDVVAQGGETGSGSDDKKVFIEGKLPSSEIEVNYE
jgi:hypothetical protein